MPNLYLTDKSEFDKLLNYFPVSNVFDTARAFPDDSSIGLYIQGLSKITEEAMNVLASCADGVLPFGNMNEAFVDEWSNCLGIGSEALPTRYSLNLTNSIKANWVKYTMYGFEEMYTLEDLNKCFEDLGIPIIAYTWATAPPEFKTDLYTIQRNIEAPTLSPIGSYTPTAGRERFVLILKSTGNLFASKGFPYDFPVDFVDNYSETAFLGFVLNLIPYYMTVLVNLSSVGGGDSYITTLSDDILSDEDDNYLIL